ATEMPRASPSPLVRSSAASRACLAADRVRPKEDGSRPDVKGANGRRAAVLGGNRVPFGRRDGAYARASNQDMLTASLDGLVGRFGLQGERAGEVAAGAVLKHSRDFNLTRESVLGSELAPDTPAYDAQQACGTSLE